MRLCPHEHIENFTLYTCQQKRWMFVSRAAVYLSAAVTSLFVYFLCHRPGFKVLEKSETYHLFPGLFFSSVLISKVRASVFER